METIYILTSRMMNGTVTMYTHSAAFATKKLAEKTMEKLKELIDILPFLKGGDSWFRHTRHQSLD